MGENKVREDTVTKEESKSVAPYESICCISHGHSSTRNLNFYILSWPEAKESTTHFANIEFMSFCSFKPSAKLTCQQTCHTQAPD